MCIHMCACWCTSWCVSAHSCTPTRACTPDTPTHTQTHMALLAPGKQECSTCVHLTLVRVHTTHTHTHHSRTPRMQRLCASYTRACAPHTHTPHSRTPRMQRVCASYTRACAPLTPTTHARHTCRTAPLTTSSSARSCAMRMRACGRAPRPCPACSRHTLPFHRQPPVCSKCQLSLLSLPATLHAVGWPGDVQGQARVL